MVGAASGRELDPLLLTQDELATFWSRIRVGDLDECWPWVHSSRSGDYGILSTKAYRNLLAHRIAWALANGVIPSRTLIRHSCDNGLCCNSRHLLAGTPHDNTSDMIQRERMPHQLPWATVESIRKLAKEGALSGEIARKFHISVGTASKIVNNRKYVDSNFEPQVNLTKGEKNHWARLTEVQVIEARKRRANGESVAKIASDLGIAVSTATEMLNGWTWKHLPGAVNQTKRSRRSLTHPPPETSVDL